MLTQEKARELFFYCVANGKLYWAKDRGGTAKRNTKAGTTSRTGYLDVMVGGKTYRTHRVIWLMVFGRWPDGDIDHVNGTRDDNRLANLRSVDRSENSKNRRISSNNASGKSGVYWCKEGRKWKCQINQKKVRVYLGFFSSKEDAIKAREEAEIAYGFHKNHGTDRPRYRESNHV